MIFFTKYFLIIFLFLTSISAKAGDLKLGKIKAEVVCSACHGLDGQATSGGNSPLKLANPFNSDNHIIKFPTIGTGWPG